MQFLFSGERGKYPLFGAQVAAIWSQCYLSLLPLKCNCMQSDVTRVSFATAKSDKKAECNYCHHIPPSFDWIVIEEFLNINVCILIKNMSTTKLCKQIHFEKFSTRFSSFMFNIKQICRTHERERKRERVWGGLKKLLKREWTKGQKREQNRGR